MGEKIIYPWGNSRPFNSYTDYCKAKYGSRVQKVSINAGFSCPNRDGTVGTGGCTFCNNKGFVPSYCHENQSVTIQLDRGLSFLKERYKRAAIFVAYFQAYSNTYGELAKLKEIFGEALTHIDISGISIGTRPDCVDDEKLDYIAKLADKHIVSVEYGVESIYDETLLLINRGHTFEESRNAILKTASRGLHTTAHFIIGLPGETSGQILEQSKVISQLPINSVKFHQLQIVKDTVMAEQFQENPKQFRFFELNEYVELMVKFLENLRPDISVERFASEVPPQFNLRPSWNKIRNYQVTQMIEREMIAKNTWQGKKWF